MAFKYEPPKFKKGDLCWVELSGKSRQCWDICIVIEVIDPNYVIQVKRQPNVTRTIPMIDAYPYISNTWPSEKEKEYRYLKNWNGIGELNEAQLDKHRKESKLDRCLKL